MPQVFQVLKCYKCLVFQIHQTKKSNKFQCKMCGEKQSIKRHYGLGNGLECRKHVQKLNAVRGELDESKLISDDYSDNEDVEVETKLDLSDKQLEKNSKWSDYVETEEVTATPNPSDDLMYLDDTEVVLEVPKKRRKTLGHFKKNPKHRRTHLNGSDSDENIQTNSETLVTNDSNLHKIITDNNYNKKTETGLSGTKNHSEFYNSESNHIKHGDTISNFSQPSNKSKWLHFESEITNSEIDSKQIPSHSSPNLPVKENKSIFVPPAIDKNSKWAKFAEEIEDNGIKISDTNQKNDDNILFIKSQQVDVKKHLLEENSKAASFKPLAASNNTGMSSPNPPIDHDSKNYPQMLFSLCDENEIDEYLTI